MAQTRWQSLYEVSVDCIIGYSGAVVLQLCFYGWDMWREAGAVSLLAYVWTFGRRYVIRRWMTRREG